MDRLIFFALVVAMPFFVGGALGHLAAAAFELLDPTVRHLYWIVPVQFAGLIGLAAYIFMETAPQLGMIHLFTFFWALFGWIGASATFVVKVRQS